jgi:RNA polymerase sigma-70 factor, ECF subfamily
VQGNRNGFSPLEDEFVCEEEPADWSFELDEEKLQAALDAMPETYRSPVLLYYFEDLSYKEIAAVLEVPLGTVMSRLSRGKTFLREKLAVAPAGVADDPSK